MVALRRLVYAPKAYVFIRSSNQSTTDQSRIYDVSDDVVNGSVTRNVDDASKAQLTLRNRFKKYIRDPKTGESIFLPMDMISIWLQRIAGKPIRVFTGYLDSCPYYQGYPGSCTIEATCTLKRLFYQWFDPGLLFFREWLQKAGGWYMDPATGVANNFQAQSNPNADDPGKINDGSFGQLIYDFMTQMAGWQDDMVIVSDIDPQIPQKAAELYQNIVLSSEHDLATLSDLLSKVMGLSVNRNAAQTGHLSGAHETITRTIKKYADVKNIPLVVPVVAALVASAYDPTRAVTDLTNPNWGYGLFGLRPSVSALHRGGHIIGDTVDGYTIKELMSVKNSTKCFIDRLMMANVNFTTASGGGETVSQGGDLKSRANAGDGNAIQTWVESALGRGYDVQTFANQLERAKRYALAWNSEHPSSQTTVMPTSLTATQHLTWTSGEVTGFLKRDGQMKIYQNVYQGHIYNSLAPYYWRSQTMYANISLGDRSRNQSSHFTQRYGQTTTSLAHQYDALVLTSSTSDQGQLRAFFDDMKTQLGFDSVSWNGKDPEAWSQGRRVSNNTPGLYGPSNSVLIRAGQDAPYPTWAGSRTVVPTQGAIDVKNNDPTHNLNNGNPLSMEQLGAISLNAAFQAQFSFPVDFMTSQSLTGERALMNDISCYEGMQQFCQASLRSFMSTPDGKFLAFYPDYFSALRKPYWSIYDIEITNFGIQLNDAQLATHVYVTGDTFGRDGAITFQDRVSTAGVATIAQAFILESFIVPEKGERPTTWGRLKDAYDFLQHYGARPLSIDAPYIKNTQYEFLMAFQVFMQKWASQFATNVTFTFQPEVMAGGIIKFPDHEIQMFCQSVTHTFDYTTGFNTEATLMAPAATSNRAKGLYPGMALAGSVNTVGTGIGG